MTTDYIVKAGDTLSEIAAKHNCTVPEILRANPSTFDLKGTIFPGQKIQVPTKTVPEPVVVVPTPVAPPQTVLLAKQLQSICGKTARPIDFAVLCEGLNVGMTEAEITTPLRICHFLGQILTETGNLQWFTELGNKAYFLKYDGRSDLGNTQPGDGYRYRGRGFIQLTGRANYKRVGDKLGLDLIGNPDVVASDYMVGARVAGVYWTSRNINVVADKDDVKAVTKLVNGGYNGLNERIEWLAKAKKILMK